MSKKPLFLLAILGGTFLILPSPIMPTSAFQFGGQEFWFYLTEPGIIRFPDMFLTVRNNNDDPIIMNCSYEHDQGINLTVHFEWTQTLLNPSEGAINHYWFEVHENYNITLQIRLVLQQEPIAGQGNPITGAGAIINYITFYSEAEGYKLDLRITDQSGYPRESQVQLYYKPNTTLAWTPIRHENTTRIQGIFPRGIYYAYAKDLATDRTGELKFGLTEDSVIELGLLLVGFGLFQYIPPDPENRSIGIHCTVNNYVGTLHETYIFAELYREEKLVGVTNKDYRQEFEKTTGLSLSFAFKPMNLKKGNYTIVGKIESVERVIAESRIEFELLQNYSLNQENPLLEVILLLISITFGSLYLITTIQKRRLQNKLQKNYDT